MCNMNVTVASKKFYLALRKSRSPLRRQPSDLLYSLGKVVHSLQLDVGHGALINCLPVEITQIMGW